MALFIPTYHNKGRRVDVSNMNWRQLTHTKDAWIWASWVKGGE